MAIIFRIIFWRLLSEPFYRLWVNGVPGTARLYGWLSERHMRAVMERFTR